MGGWRARLLCRGLESDIEAVQAELGGVGLVKPMCDDDRCEELTVPWSELVGCRLYCVWWWGCSGIQWLGIFELAW